MPRGANPGVSDWKEGDRAMRKTRSMPVQSPSRVQLDVGEAQLRAILDSIPARVALLDRDRRHCYLNREYPSFVGRAAEEILGRSVAEILGKEAFAAYQRDYAPLQPFGERALAGEAGRWEGWLPDTARGELCFVQRYYVPYRG